MVFSNLRCPSLYGFVMRGMPIRSQWNKRRYLDLIPFVHYASFHRHLITWSSLRGTRMQGPLLPLYDGYRKICTWRNWKIDNIVFSDLLERCCSQLCHSFVNNEWLITNDLIVQLMAWFPFCFIILGLKQMEEMLIHWWSNKSRKTCFCEVRPFVL